MFFLIIYIWVYTSIFPFSLQAFVFRWKPLFIHFTASFNFLVSLFTFIFQFYILVTPFLKICISFFAFLHLSLYASVFVLKEYCRVTSLHSFLIINISLNSSSNHLILLSHYTNNLLWRPFNGIYNSVLSTFESLILIPSQNHLQLPPSSTSS